MKSGWVDSGARAAIDRYARNGVAPDLALRVYTTRLLGRDPKLVLHGGGNTSVKTTMSDLLGEKVAVLCVKGSGSDMATVERAELYDGRVGIVPYVMPGFLLAKAAAEIYDAKPAVEGLILHKHGIFSFGDSARDAYERMIALVALAEERLQKKRKAVFVTTHLP